MGLLTTEMRRSLIALLLRLPNIEYPEVRQRLASDTLGDLARQLPQPGIPDADIRALVSLADDQHLWVVVLRPNTLRLCDEALALLLPEMSVYNALHSLRLQLEDAAGKSPPPAPAPHAAAAIPTPDRLRRVLLECFSAGELEIFCFDHYYQLYIETNGHTHAERGLAVLARCRADGTLATLAAQLRKERMRCFDRIMGEL